MNVLPCRLEEKNGALIATLSDNLTLPLPASRTARYRPHLGNGKLLLGVRPEHLTEARANMEPGVVPFDVGLDVTEPMGMETLVYFDIGGHQVCGRVDPNAGARDGQPMRLAANLNNMHLIDASTGAVL